MPKKSRALKKLEEKIVKQTAESSEPEFEELEHKVSEDKRESEEGMGIEKEEEAEEEAYPEIKKAIKEEADEEEEEE